MFTARFPQNPPVLFCAWSAFMKACRIAALCQRIMRKHSQRGTRYSSPRFAITAAFIR